MSSDFPLDPLDPIAKKLREAVAQSKQQKDVATGEHLLKADFEALARQAAPDKFAQLVELLRERGALINAQKPAEIQQQLHYQPVNHLLEAGKFAVQLQPLERLKEYSVTVLVGLHPNAAQFMAKLPTLKTRRWEFRAAADEDGFFWVDGGGHRRAPHDIITDALDTLTNLLVADFDGRL